MHNFSGRVGVVVAPSAEADDDVADDVTDENDDDDDDETLVGEISTMKSRHPISNSSTLFLVSSSKTVMGTLPPTCACGCIRANSA